MDALIVVIAFFCSVVVPIWGIVDAASRSRLAFYASGSKKMAWIVVQIAAFFLGLGFFLSGFYLLRTRRRVAQAALRV
ncbi:MAG TPA: hypothetical protein VGG38_19690 [Acidimicrobiales bacterium]|jgi:hypothetical protein